METIERRATTFVQRRLVWWKPLSWTSAGIRTKILVPLFLLMLLSLLGSTVGFIISTNATRNSIFDTQLTEDAGRVQDALELGVREATESGKLLANDGTLQDALLREANNPLVRDNDSLEMSDRVVPVLNRFDLDQAIVANIFGQYRVNIAPSGSEAITIHAAGEAFSQCIRPDTRTVQFQAGAAEPKHLLITCTPIVVEVNDEMTGVPVETIIGHVYTLLDIPAWIERIKSDLELAPDLLLISSQEAASTIPAEASRVHAFDVPLGEGAPLDDVICLALRLDTSDINDILASGLRVTFISSAMTLLFALLVGTWLAQSFIRPIHKLARVAESVSAGDFSRRANLTHRDEIGLLGRSIDHATSTISDLLNQQAHAAGERAAILNSIADGVLAVDDRERILVINPAAATLLEQDADQLLGRPLETLAAPDDPVMIVGLQQIAGQIRSELLDPDMAPTREQVSLGQRIVRIHSTPTLVNGTRTGAVVVIQDVTDMVEADRAKSAFIATASHEMRTPLTSLKGFVDVFVLSGTDNLNESQTMFLDTIKRQTDNMVQMVNDLLEMARLEQGAQRMEQRWVQPASTIDEALKHLHTVIEQRQVHCRVELPTHLPPIWIDPMHLRRILTNLLSNAVKYVYTGGNVQIHVYELDDPADLPGPPHDEQPWQHAEQRSLVIAIEDDGVGIREEDQPNIFGRFFRSENPLSVEVGGSGLGLSITRSLVLIHAGQIGFRSVENAGSCFWVRLPTPSTDPMQYEAEQPDHAAPQVAG